MTQKCISRAYVSCQEGRIQHCTISCIIPLTLNHDQWYRSCSCGYTVIESLISKSSKLPWQWWWLLGVSNTALVDHGFGWQRDYNHGHEREMEQLYDTNQTQIRIQDGAFTHSSQRRETHVIYQFIYIDANYKYNITYTSPKTHITSHTAYIICISYIIYPIYLILYMKSILSNTQASPPHVDRVQSQLTETASLAIDQGGWISPSSVQKYCVFACFCPVDLQDLYKFKKHVRNTKPLKCLEQVCRLHEQISDAGLIQLATLTTSKVAWTNYSGPAYAAAVSGYGGHM